MRLLLVCSFIDTPTSQETADGNKDERDYKQDECERPVSILSCSSGFSEVLRDLSGDIDVWLEESLECEDVVWYLAPTEHQGNGQRLSDGACEPQYNGSSQACHGCRDNCFAHHLPACRTQGQAGLAHTARHCSQRVARDAQASAQDPNHHYPDCHPTT